MNIYDVSKKAGVSIATVSRVINGSNNVSPTTREKVLKVIDESGYEPNTFARGLGYKSMKTVGLMCADVSDPYIASAIFHLEKNLRSLGYDSLLSCTGHQLENKQKTLELLLAKRMEAIILVGSNFIENHREDQQYILEGARKTPIFLMGGSLAGGNIYSIVCDDFSATYEATHYLIEEGRNKLIYLYDHTTYSGLQKVSGFKAACKAHLGLTSDEIETCIHMVKGDILEIKQQLLEKSLDMDGVITANDTLAVGVLKYAREKRIQVPEHLSVIGYNNSLLSNCSEPELTSIDNHLEALCSNCTTTLERVLKEEMVPRESIFPATLVQRSSTLTRTLIDR